MKGRMKKLAVLSSLAVVLTSSSALASKYDEKDASITCNEKTQTCYLRVDYQLYNLNYVGTIDIYRALGKLTLWFAWPKQGLVWKDYIEIQFSSEENMRKFLETITGQPVKR